MSEDGHCKLIKGTIILISNAKGLQEMEESRSRSRIDSN